MDSVQTVMTETPYPDQAQELESPEPAGVEEEEGEDGEEAEIAVNQEEACESPS